MRKILLITVVIVASGAAEPDADKAVEVSLVQLLARPLDFDGQRVRVIGYVTVGSEEEAIYLDPQDYEHGVLANAVKLNLENKKMPLESNEYGLVEGVFHAKTPAHSVQRGIAEIDSITKLEPWFLSAKSRRARAARTQGCWYFLDL